MIYIISATILICIYALYEFFEHKCILFNHYKINLGLNIKAAVISDIHNKIFFPNVFAHLKAEAPDFIFIPGDVPIKSTGHYKKGLKTLQRLSKIAPVYYSFGNHELSMREKFPEEFKNYLNSLPENITILNNSHIRLTDTAEIYGISLFCAAYKKGKFPDYKKFPEFKFTDMNKNAGVLSINPDNKISADTNPTVSNPTVSNPAILNPTRKILLAHNPDFYEYYAGINDWDLIISGHNHGGVIRLPFTDGIIFPTFGIKHRTKGIYNKNHFVSAGAGEHLIPARVFNRCSIDILSL